MQSVLTARLAAKNALATVLPRDRVLYAGASQPTGGTYAVLTVVSAPAVNDWGGEAYSPVRVQVDVWSYAPTDTTALTTAEQGRVALEAAGFRRVGGGLPIGVEGQPDAAGNRWQRVSSDYVQIA